MPIRRFAVTVAILAAAALAAAVIVALTVRTGSAAAPRTDSPAAAAQKRYHEATQKSFGVDARQLVNDLRSGRDPGRPRPKKPYPYRKAELPASLPGLPGWKFDTEGFRHRLARQTVTDKEGYLRMKTEEYAKSPTEDNLLPVNPTIRALNYEEEKFATGELDAVKSYTRCDDVITPLLRKEEADILKEVGSFGDRKQWLEGKCWQVAPELFFTIVADYSGAWQVRSYAFRIRRGGRLLTVAEFDSFPGAGDARLAYGVSRLVPEALNNFAILRAEEFGDPEEIVDLLEAAGERLPLARHNLYLYLLNQGRSEEARKVRASIPAKDRLPAPEPAVK